MGMFINISKNNGKDYLRLEKSKRVKNGTGQKVSRKTIVANIGPLEKYDDGEPGYMERLRASFRAGEPLIAELGKYVTKERKRERYTVSFEEGDPRCAGAGKKYGHRLIERVMEWLGLRNVMASYKGFSKLKYDVWGFFKLLVYGRILEPASKIGTVGQNGDYYEGVLGEGYNEDNVYDTLDFVWEHKGQIIRRMNTSMMKKAGRRADMIYYDVTNFYFEVEEPDADEVGENGGVVETGLRKPGVSKENRKEPIVQMGLFMDESGVPIGIEAFPGNTLDHLTLKDALKKNIDGLEYSRFILVGDRGICMYPNLLRLKDGGHGYIVAKSLAKSTAAEREWAYGESGYAYEGKGFKRKSRVAERKVTDENGKVRTITEKVVVYWSEKFEKKQLAENKSFLEFIAKLAESPGNFRATAAQAKSVRKFLRKELVNEKTGEVLDSSDLLASLDMDKINHFTEGFGYYQIVTSELTMPDAEVIDKYHGLSRIEDQFRVLKGNLETRPMFVRTPEHINAHLLICMVALVVIRIIQNRIVSSQLPPSQQDKTVYWTSGLSAERIQRALNRWQLEALPGDFFRFLNIDDPDLILILNAFNINIPFKFFSRADLKSIKSSISV
jgi:transposase